MRKLLKRPSISPVAALICAALACAVLICAGCAKERPIVSMEGGSSNMTLTEQREWVAEQFDSAIAASGKPDGWIWSGGAIVPRWTSQHDEDRAMVLGSLLPNDCGGGSGRLSTSLQNPTTDGPLEATAKVRAYWESKGLPVRDLYDTHHDTEPYFIVDFEDGGVFSMQASVDGMSISARTPCSANYTVTNWQAYLDDEGNPFEEELRSRDESNRSRE